MRKVLIIGEIWPYHRGAGDLAHLIAKHLPKLGWEPIVLTTPLPNFANINYKIIEVGYTDLVMEILKSLGYNPDKSIRCQLTNNLNLSSEKHTINVVFRTLNEIFTYPVPKKGWKFPAIKAASNLIENEGIDAMITDSPPLISNIIASSLKKKYNIPWIAYQAHLWSQNNGYGYSSIRKFLDRNLELRTLKNADILVALSDPCADKLKALHNGKRVYTIFEGFDPEIVNDPPVKLTQDFSITYTGSFAPLYREPTMLFSSLRDLISKNIIDPNKINVRFYGQEVLWVENLIDKYGLKNIVKQFGKIPIETSYMKQKESQLLYNPKWTDPNDRGIYGGKIFEYIAARRPILATGGYSDVVDELLQETRAGVWAKSKEELDDILKNYYIEYIKNGNVAFHGDRQKIEKYSSYETAKEFVKFLSYLI